MTPQARSAWLVVGGTLALSLTGYVYSLLTLK